MSQSNQKEVRVETELDNHLKKLDQFISEQNWENSITVCEELLIICTEKLLEIAPEKTQPEKYTILGDFLLEQGRIAGALACYNQATDLNEKLANFYKNSGLNCLEKKDFAQALNYFKKVLELSPNSAENQSNLGSIYAHLQCWEKAIYHYQEALKLNPKLAAVYRNLARLFKKVGQEKEANNCWYQAYILEPNLTSTDKYYELGNKLLKYQEIEKAIFCYQKAIELEPNHILAYDILGQIFTKQEQSQQSLEIYQKLGQILSNQGRYKEGIESYKRAIKFSKSLGEIDKTLIAQYQEIIEKYRDSSAEDYFELGKLLGSQGNFNQAVDLLIKSISISPYFNESHVWLQYTPIDTDKQKEVVVFYRELLKKHPKFALAWGNLGDFLTGVNEITEAIECYQKSAYLKTIYKNPELEKLTWPSEKTKGPDFLIIGTTKGGTTSLNGYIGFHPQVLLPHKKEISFFNKYINHGVNWYLSHFPSITDNSEYLTGEATPAYLSSREVESKVYNLFPDVKLIVLLRNPIDQVISWHYHKVNSGIYQKTLEQAIIDELKPIDNLTEDQIEKILTHQTYNLMSCLYYYHFKRWLKYFPREQFLIIKSEDFFANPAPIVKNVYNFLELPEYQLENYPKLNTGYYPPISDQIKQRLADYFRPHNQKLEEFLGMKFNWD